MYAHAHMHVMVYMWRSKDSYVGLAFFFYLYVGSDGQTQVARPLPVNHLTSPQTLLLLERLHWSRGQNPSVPFSDPCNDAIV